MLEKYQKDQLPPHVSRDSFLVFFSIRFAILSLKFEYKIIDYILTVLYMDIFEDSFNFLSKLNDKLNQNRLIIKVMIKLFCFKLQIII